MRAAMSLFDLFQFLALFVRKVCSHLLMRLVHDLVDTPASIAPHLPELRGRFIDYWRYFGDLFWRQMQLSTQPVSHSCGHHTGLMKLKEKMTRMYPTKKSTRHSTSDEDEDEAGN
jgi:hypothetical protein